MACTSLVKSWEDAELTKVILKPIFWQSLAIDEGGRVRHSQCEVVLCARVGILLKIDWLIKTNSAINNANQHKPLIDSQLNLNHSQLSHRFVCLDTEGALKPN